MSTNELREIGDEHQARRSGSIVRPNWVKLPTIEQEAALLFFLRMIRRRKWTVIAATILIPLLTLIAALQSTPLYTASLKILFEPKRLNVGDVERVIDPGLPDTSLESQVQILQSRDLARRSIEMLGLENNPEFNYSLRPPSFSDRVKGGVTDAARWVDSSLLRPIGLGLFREETPADVAWAQRNVMDGVINVFLSSLYAETVGRSQVIQIYFTSEDPVLAAEAVDVLANNYIDNQLEVKFDAMQRATNWLNTRLEKLREQVETSETRIEQFRAKAGLVEGVRSDIITEQISAVSDQLVAAQAELTAAEARLARVNAFAQSPVDLESVPDVLRSGLIQDLRNSEAALLNREAELGARVGDRHPDLIEVRAQLERLQTKITAEVRRVSRGLDSEVSTARARVASLRDELRSAQNRASRADAAEIRLRALEREARANQEILQTFLQRSKELSEQFEIEEPDARILSSAYVPLKPSHPKTGIYLAIAIFAGIAIGLFLALLEDLLDQTLRTNEEVEEALGLPSVGIPKIGRPGWRIPVVDYVVVKPASVFAETMRSLRTLLWLTDVKNRAKCVLITSSRSGEGKTTTAVSLARAGALSGERVILIDCDFARPAIETALRSQATPNGLIQLLRGEVDRHEVTKTDPNLPNLQFITTGTRVGTPDDLLRSERMAVLIRELKNEYDLAVIDAPPSVIISNTKVLATMADAVIYCVRWRSTPRSAARAGIEALSDIGANLLCVALTQVNYKVRAQSEYAEAEMYAKARASGGR